MDHYKFGASVSTHHAVINSAALLSCASSFKTWMLGEDPTDPHPGCHGDPGMPEAPSTWVFGYEQAWSQAMPAAVAASLGEPAPNYEVPERLNYHFDRNLFALLTVIDGRRYEESSTHAQSRRFFELGARGYFKGNIFPFGFYSIRKWGDPARRLTGFSSKEDYQAWSLAYRVPVVRDMVEQHRPSLFIGIGAGYKRAFERVTGANAWREDSIEVGGSVKKILMSRTGLVPTVIIPGLTGAHLVKRDEIVEAGKLIRTYLKAQA